MRRDDLVVTPTGLRFLGRRLACTVGRTGTTARKCEGDGASPEGWHRIIGMLYRPDRMAQPVPWARPIRPGDLWSDDLADPDYNLLVRVPHGHGHERLRRADRLYDLVILTDWNWPRPVKGRGSAIFLHRWRGPGRPTAGCVALGAADLRWIADRITPRTRLLILPRAARPQGKRPGALSKAPRSAI
jgi:L,D-peptidoglycan transpeptidase YkuD (ErfK/YbiS/YcfS/YnhG family)